MSLLFAPLQVLAIALNTELGARRGTPEQRELLRAGASAAILVSLAVIVVALALVGAGVVPLADPVGLIVTFAGNVVFQLYYSVSRGLRQIPRAATAYVGAAVVQILAFVALVAATDPSPRAALVVYGLSSVLPVLACELRSPVLGLPVFAVRDNAMLRTLWRVAVPLIVWQLGFVIWGQADQVFVAAAFSQHDLGQYSAAKSLTQMFIVVPAAISGTMLPMMASRRAAGDLHGALRLTALVGAVGFAISSVVSLAVLVAHTPMLDLAFGREYRAAGPAMVGLAVSMTFYTVFVTIAAVAIGWKRSYISAIGMSTVATVLLVGLPLLGRGSIEAASWVVALSVAAGLSVMIALVLHRVGGLRRVAVLLRQGE